MESITAVGMAVSMLAGVKEAVKASKIRIQDSKLADMEAIDHCISGILRIETEREKLKDENIDARDQLHRLDTYNLPDPGILTGEEVVELVDMIWEWRKEHNIDEREEEDCECG